MGWRTKLFTSHDPQHIHKVLGLGALLHFLYRFRYCGASDMGFGDDAATLLCLCWHVCLSLSSFIFRLPARRVMAKGSEGSMIWPEFRLHSIIFAGRSLCCMLLIWIERRMQVDEPFFSANAVIVMVTMFLASSASQTSPSGTKVGSGSGTIRDLAAGAPVRFFFSVMQFHATAGCLVGVRRFSTQFVYVWIIQFTAFLMTLRRKALVPHAPLIMSYGVMLLIGLCVSTYDHASTGMLLLTHIAANSAAILRMGLGVDKFALWTGVAASVGVFRHAARTGLVTDELWQVVSVPLYLVTMCGVLLVGYRKVKGAKAS